MSRGAFQTHIVPLDLGPLAQRVQQVPACSCARIPAALPAACDSLVSQALVPCAGGLKQQRMWHHVRGQQRGIALYTRDRLGADIGWLEQVLVLARGAHETTLGNPERCDRASIWWEGLGRASSSRRRHRVCPAVMVGHSNKYLVSHPQ